GIRGYAVPIAVMVIFVSLSYYFNGFSRATGFGVRLVSFLVLTALCTVLIGSFSEVPYPFLHIMVTAYLPAMILSLLFILLVAHEILASFVYIASQGGSKSLRHFLLISLIYMVNIFVTCLHEIGVVDWDFIYVNLYLLLCTSAL